MDLHELDLEATAVAPGDPPPVRRPRLLMLAYSCSPDHGSEPSVGWNFARQASRFCDTWVICQEKPFGPFVRRHLERHGKIPGLEFCFLPNRPWETRVKRWPGFYYVIYNLWHRRAFHAARRLHGEIGFDLVHQVNFCTFREPGYLWRLGPPFVWGPVGGAQVYPWRFLGQADPIGAIREAVRTILNPVQFRYSWRVRRAAARASVLLAANSTTRDRFSRSLKAASMLMLETGLARAAPMPRSHRGVAGPLNVLWSGEFESWKGLPLLLKALARLPAETVSEVRILGRGRLEASYRRMAARLKIETPLSWMGWLPHREALEQYRWADVFVFTSLRDTSGNVVLESLGAGVPVVCLDHHGVGDIVTDRCGLKIPVTTPRRVVEAIAGALTLLSEDEALRRRLAEGSIERAHDYLWPSRGQQLAGIYRQVLGSTNFVWQSDRLAEPSP